ncbi:S1 family peptidase [Jidongwangia harbinensis]|uniref:S1 family peptidase n=1 Tax=Jidongwangia harbinensis TaxID=2878561 RepID=UPI001CD93051|nr:trypsin-like serine protease [Jidongwangia harbinensis]MCA2215043.1 trypsin-like serine protease [Jidongwangia harbinensis]
MRRRTKSYIAAGVLIPAVVAAMAVNAMGTANAIANGEPVPDGKYAFSAKLTLTGIPTADGGRRNSACSGALIAPQYMITAGHCFRDFNNVRQNRPVADLSTVTVGRTDLNGSGGGEAIVVAVRQAPNNQDVSIAKLDKPIRGVRPIRMGRTAPAVGTVLRVTGYGSVTSTNPVPETRLRTGQMTVAEINAQKLGVRGHAPAENTTPCPYDSGGPFFVEAKGRWGKRKPPVLVAVVSNGPSCPHTGLETPARTDNIVDWARSAMAEMDLLPPPAPNEPAPGEPAPSEPVPSEPAPGESAPVEPAPVGKGG